MYIPRKLIVRQISIGNVVISVHLASEEVKKIWVTISVFNVLYIQTLRQFWGCSRVLIALTGMYPCLQATRYVKPGK